MTPTPKQIADLKFWETEYCMAICNVNYRGNLKPMADNVDRLRALTRMRYDAINRTLAPFEED